MDLSERKKRVVDPSAAPTSTAQPAGQTPAPPPPPPPSVPHVAPKRTMNEDRARRLAKDRNAVRQPGEPIWVAWRVDPPDGRVWDVGTVVILDLSNVMPVRDFEEI